MTLDPVQLATFQAVIEQGSFDAAARALHVTPSAVSQRIKALEQVVGRACRPRPGGPSYASAARWPCWKTKLSMPPAGR
jgi:LysR family transcriptional regulator (chromosome initiation inhibitor)